jgi:transposase-like protein
MEAPKTLQEAILYFAEFENCKSFMVSLRWPKGTVKCLCCGSEKIFWIERERVWKCYGKHNHAKFSLKTGSTMEDSPISLDKWLIALWLIVNCKNGISSCEVARDLGITQKSAWFLGHRIRMSLHSGSIAKLSGHVAADELSSAARRGTCTSRNAGDGSPGLTERIRLPGSELLSVASRCVPGWFRTEGRKRFRPKSESTWRPVPCSTPMRCYRTTDSKPTAHIQVIDHAVD